MKHFIKARVAIIGSLIVAVFAALAACGGGGTSSGGGGSSVTSVSGTVNASASAALQNEQLTGPAHMLAAFGELVIPTAYAAGVAGVVVVVDCGSDALQSGTTDSEGKFRILLPTIGTGTCMTTFNGLSGPTIDVVPGSETEVDVTFDGSSVTLLSMDQKFDNTPQLEISVDDGMSDDDSSGGIASNDDDSSDDDSSDDSSDDDSSSGAHAENNADSVDGSRST